MFEHSGVCYIVSGPQNDGKDDRDDGKKDQYQKNIDLGGQDQIIIEVSFGSQEQAPDKGGCENNQQKQHELRYFFGNMFEFFAELLLADLPWSSFLIDLRLDEPACQETLPVFIQ